MITGYMYHGLKPPGKPHCPSCTEDDFGTLEPSQLQLRKDRPVGIINDTDETAEQLVCDGCGEDIQTVQLLHIGKCPQCREPMVLQTVEQFSYISPKTVGGVIFIDPSKDANFVGVGGKTWYCTKCDAEHPCELPVKFRPT